MKRSPRQAFLVAGLLIILAGVVLAAALFGGDPPAPIALDPESNHPTGARAFRLWMESLGYEIIAGDTVSRLDPTSDIFLILEPRVIVSQADLTKLDDFIGAGGTAIIAGEGFPSSKILIHYNYSISQAFSEVETLTMQNPLADQPPLTTPVTVRTASFLWASIAGESAIQGVVHLAMDQRPVVLSFERGKGRVILCAAPFVFSNAGLKEAGNAAFILHLLGGAGGRRAIFYQGEILAGVPEVGFEAWLRQSPPGRALLLAAAVIFIALLLGGRPFGRPQPLPGQVSRRAPLEAITALARLSRRAGHRSTALQLYRSELKRRLGRRYRLDPTLDDETYVAELARLRSSIDGPVLLDLLRRLQRSNPSERELVAWAKESARWMEDV